MLKFLLLLLCLCFVHASHVSKIASEITIKNILLQKNKPLNIQDLKRTKNSLIEHIKLINCSGTIDGETLKHFPKLSMLTIWRSNIEEISTTLPITHLIVINSHFPNLNANLQEKLYKIKGLMCLGNKNFTVDSLILKKFKNLQALHLSVAHFTEKCVTKNWFKDMDQLEELSLSENNLECLAEDAFSSLKKLRKLDLTYNHIPNLDLKTFKKLTKLEFLGIYKNNIENVDLATFSSQKNHLEILGVDWKVVENISPENLIKTLPKLKTLSFGHKILPEDYKVGDFCQSLRENGVSCEVDYVFGVARLLGYSMIGHEKCDD